MSLTTQIENIVNTLYPDAHYFLRSWMKANKESYDLNEMTIAKPLIVLNNEIPKDKEIQDSLNTLAETRIIMWFLAKPDDGVYATDPTMNTLLEQLEPIADRVYNNIFLLDNIRLLEGQKFRYRLTPKFKIWNSALVGWEAEARVRDNQLTNFCTSP